MSLTDLKTNKSQRSIVAESVGRLSRKKDKCETKNTCSLKQKKGGSAKTQRRSPVKRVGKWRFPPLNVTSPKVMRVRTSRVFEEPQSAIKY